jgi:hypothetical protein
MHRLNISLSRTGLRAGRAFFFRRFAGQTLTLETELFYIQEVYTVVDQQSSHLSLPP